MYTYKATILTIHDGDTFFAEVDLGFHVRKDMWLRLAGVNTPEMPTPEGAAARQFVDDWLLGHPTVTVITERDRKGSEKQTFGRYVAHVHNALGESLAAAIIAAGHGKARKA
jgi:endonuclease YncB( thermonuclease family)